MIADETCCLTDADAAAAEDRVLPLAPGAQGTLDRLRAKVYIALLTGQRPGTLLPRPQPQPATPEPARTGPPGCAAQ